MNTKRTALHVLAASAILACNLLPVSAHAQAWPSQPIKIIVPFPAGGASDQIGRIMAKAIGDELKVPVVVENRSGANGSVGATVLAKAAPDGYTLMVASIGVYAINAGLFSKLPYDPLKDFAPISVLVSTPNVLVVPANSRFNTAQELAKYMKQNPGKLSYATSGAGSSDHLTGELFKNVVGGFAVHIPYRGGAPAMQDIIGGQADFMFSNLGPAMPFIKGGKMKALMLTAEQARAAVARRADRRQGRHPAGSHELAGAGRARGHAARDHPALERDCSQRHERARREGTHGHPGVRHRREFARRVQRFPEEGSGALEEGGEGFGRGDGLTGPRSCQNFMAVADQGDGAL